MGSKCTRGVRRKQTNIKDKDTNNYTDINNPHATNDESKCKHNEENHAIETHDSKLNSSQNDGKTNLTSEKVFDVSSLYSINKLSLNTQHLLNSKCEFESNLNSESVSSKNSMKNLREIQAYLLAPFKLPTASKSNAPIYHLFDLIHHSYSNQNNNSLNTESLFNQLRFYSAQEINNCDFNLIDINTNNNSTNSINGYKPNEANPNCALLTNKYFRRSVGKAIIKDLLNLRSRRLKKLNNYASCFNLFIILLSNAEFEDENNLLCPERIELNDFKRYFQSSLDKNESDLFYNWYKLNQNENVYVLDYNYHLNQTTTTSASWNLNELDKLFEILKAKLDEYKTNDASEIDAIKMKYFKSIQQDEIELITRHAEPNSIVWFHLISPAKVNTSKLNRTRYSNTLELLQTKVLKHNYKKVQLNFANATSDEDMIKTVQVAHEKQMNDFLFNSIKLLLDNYINDLNKIQNSSFTLKIDKELGQEIHRHFELYKFLKVNHLNDTNNLIEIKSYKQFESIVDTYLNDLTSKHPLALYDLNEENEPVDQFALNIANYIRVSIDEKKLNNKSIIYRFCGNTIVSSELSTLLQSVLHQLCYLIGVHESMAFNSIGKVIDNVCQAFDERLSASHEQYVIVLNRVDRAIKTNADQEILNHFLKRVYSSSAMSNLKLILTFSITNLHRTKHIEDLFKSAAKSSIISINSRSNHELKREPLLQLETLFNNDLNFTMNLFVLLLSQTRYGVKECELIDIIRAFNAKNSSCATQLQQQANRLNDYFVQSVWYCLKYYSIVFKSTRNFLESSVQNRQLVYKLNGKSDMKTIDEQLKQKFNAFVYTFYNQSIENRLSTKSTISYLANRAYFELPKYFYHANPTNNTRQSFLNTFVLNSRWLLNKASMCGNMFYFVHDLELMKSLYNIDDQAKQIESFFYSILFELYQDPNQLNLHAKLDTHVGNLFTFASEKSSSSTSLSSTTSNQSLGGANIQFFPINYKQVVKELNDSIRNAIATDSLNTKMIHFNQVEFLTSTCFLTLCEQQNELKIWKVNNQKDVNSLAGSENAITLIRSIKFNKPPRGLRLFNKNIAVLLIERNLHLFDLNQCKHLFDLNSTMNPILPVFEIHDSNHLVLLARNRLSVTLMKVAFDDLSVSTSSTSSSSNSTEINGKRLFKSDDMFLFKAGEDRYLNSLLVSRNGKIMVCGDEVQKPFPLLVWNLVHRKLVYDLRLSNCEFLTSIQAISSSGHYVVCACQEDGESTNCLVIYDLSTGQLFKKLRAKVNYMSVEISEESNIVIACLENAQIIIYDLTNGSKKFTLNSNRFPINKIKILDTNKNFKNYFLTYDTTGYDRTIRVWDLTKGDTIIKSFACPSRIVSCAANLPPLYYDHVYESNDDELVLAVSLFGISKLLILKLTNAKRNSTCVVNASLHEENFDQDVTLNGLKVEINI